MPSCVAVQLASHRRGQEHTRLPPPLHGSFHVEPQRKVQLTNAVILARLNRTGTGLDKNYWQKRQSHCDFVLLKRESVRPERRMFQLQTPSRHPSQASYYPATSIYQTRGLGLNLESLSANISCARCIFSSSGSVNVLSLFGAPCSSSSGK